jgi:predicted phosphoribosyltransferase
VLARLLNAHRGRPDVAVLGLPRGGIPVAWEVAAALGAPLDAFVVRKLGASAPAPQLHVHRLAAAAAADRHRASLGAGFPSVSPLARPLRHQANCWSASHTSGV